MNNLDSQLTIRQSDVEIAKVKNDVIWIKRLVLGLYGLAVPDTIQFFANTAHHLGVALHLIR